LINPFIKYCDVLNYFTGAGAEGSFHTQGKAASEVGNVAVGPGDDAVLAGVEVDGFPVNKKVGCYLPEYGIPDADACSALKVKGIGQVFVDSDGVEIESHRQVPRL
jgi:hypothetical protein